jgi:ferric-dicitrate binding protein FerR (iron transport regulator)
MSSTPRVDRALVYKFFTGQCSAAEQEAVRNWLLDPENEVVARSYVQDVWNDTLPAEGDADAGALLEQTWQRVDQRAHARVKMTYWRVAAALLVLAGASAALFYFSRLSVDSILPAGAGRALSSATGQIVMRVLPDGTKVWLNAESTIRYPESFAGLAEREVWLEGEAYFDVTEDKQHSFIVHAREVNIRVLGTAFNVKSYAGDARVETTLVRGKVALETGGRDAKKIELKPNQRAVFSRESKDLALVEVETDRYTAWMSGSLVFEDSPVEDVIKALERWYGVTIHLKDKNNLQCRLTARIDRESLAETLDLLKSTTGIAYTIHGDQIEIAGTLCNPIP